MSGIKLAVLLGVGHGLADCASGFLVLSVVLQLPLSEGISILLLYNAIGFGGQVLVGWLTDTCKIPYRTLAAGGLFSLGLALPLSGWTIGSVILAGIGSAMFHVGAGLLSLKATPQKAVGSGFFLAPGVFGLAVGSWLAINYTDYMSNLWWVLLPLLSLFIFFLAPSSASSYTPSLSQIKSLPTKTILLMALLLLAVALRSALWNSTQSLAIDDYSLLLWLGAVAAAGKIAGGFGTDFFGERSWIIGALVTGAGLLVFSNISGLLLLAGVFLLQSATPPMLSMAVKLLPGWTATATGLVLGLAILMGGFTLLPGVSMLLLTPVGIVSMVGVVVLLVLWVEHRQKEPQSNAKSLDETGSNSNVSISVSVVGKH